MSELEPGQVYRSKATDRLCTILFVGDGTVTIRDDTGKSFCWVKQAFLIAWALEGHHHA